MNSRDITLYVVELESENAVMRLQLERDQQTKVEASRFYAAKLDVKAVAELHDVHPETIHKYVRLGLIEKHPDSTDSKIFIRGSVAITLDFHEMKRRSKVLPYQR